MKGNGCVFTLFIMTFVPSVWWMEVI